MVGALGACDSLLEADLPYLLTDAAIQGAGTAETQVNSAQALFECGISTFGWIAMGHEDVFESIAGVAGGAHVFLSTPRITRWHRAAIDSSCVTIRMVIPAV
jgi:hypothetical protein